MYVWNWLRASEKMLGCGPCCLHGCILSKHSHPVNWGQSKWGAWKIKAPLPVLQFSNDCSSHREGLEGAGSDQTSGRQDHPGIRDGRGPGCFCPGLADSVAPEWDPPAALLTISQHMPLRLIQDRTWGATNPEVYPGQEGAQYSETPLLLTHLTPQYSEGA